MKLARLLSYRCLGLCVTRCTSPGITHADTPPRRQPGAQLRGASGGGCAFACSCIQASAESVRCQGFTPTADRFKGSGRSLKRLSSDRVSVIAMAGRFNARPRTASSKESTGTE